MTPTFSVIAPTRQRVAVLDRMLHSLWATAGDPSHVEVVLRCDDDDHETVPYVQGRGTEMCLVGSRLNGYATLATLINEAARQATGDLVLVVNDDAEFQTPGWDLVLRQYAEPFADGLFDFGVETANAGHFIFPCVSRTLIEVLGCVFDERLVYTDIWLRDVLMPFGRAIRVPEVTIAHHWQGPTADQNVAAATTRTADYAALYDRCVEEGRAKIRTVISC